MKALFNNRTRKLPGRPRTSSVERPEQLRLAKRAQRERERVKGLAIARLKLPVALANRLAFAARQDGFEAALDAFLQVESLEIAKYPQLKFLCWNRPTKFIPAREAWDLYERNWRFVDVSKLEPPEKELLQTLASRFGGGLIIV